MKLARVILLTLVVHTMGVRVEGQTVKGPETVVVPSGTLRLRALLWRPGGSGRFPAVHFHHGRGPTPQTEGRVEGITELGRVFASHGYVFMALFRRGEGLSADQGVFIGDLLERERASQGEAAAKKLQLRLLETDHLEDALAGLALLRMLPGVDGRRVAVVGHSFGGSLALLVAERDGSLRAAVNFAGAAGSWEGSAELRERLTAAAGRLTAPVLVVYAANDFSVARAKRSSLSWHAAQNTTGSNFSRRSARPRTRATGSSTWPSGVGSVRCTTSSTSTRSVEPAGRQSGHKRGATSPPPGTRLQPARPPQCNRPRRANIYLTPAGRPCAFPQPAGRGARAESVIL